VNPIVLTGFAGSNIDKHPRLLPAGVGVNVVDAEPGRGDLRPLRARLTVATVPTSPQRKTIYRIGRDTPNDAQYWLSWTTVVSVMRGFDATDPTERTYFTGSGTPKWTDNAIGLTGGPPYPQAVRELAMPAPISPLVATLNTDGTTGDAGDVFYVHTFVNDLGWESAPSPISIAVNCKPGATIDLTSLEAAPAGNYGINRRRIYRTSPGSTNTSVFLFLREVTIGTTSTTDDARALGDQLATIGWTPPPSGAFGLLGLWNGMAAMLYGKSVLFTPPDTPYTTPAKWDQPVQNTPIALAKWEQNLLVLTTASPVLFQGQDPAGMSETPFAVGYACAGAQSVVSFHHGVAWASNEGLAYTGNTRLLTEDVIHPDQWKAMNPATMIAGRWGRFYVCSYDAGGGTRKGFMFDPLTPGDGVWWLSTGFDACWYDELADALYVLEGGNVRKFAGDPASVLAATFKDKVHAQVGPRNFALAKVLGDVYPLTFKVWADGVLRHTRTVQNQIPFTLPDGFTAFDWQAEVSGVQGSVQAVILATDVDDFKRVGNG